MSKIVSMYSKKGGVGKTTLALNFAFYLKSLGKSVEFIDLDPQQSALPFFKDEQSSDTPIIYSNNVRHTLKTDFVVIDYPPGATLDHKVKGYPVLISNPTKMSIRDTYLSVINAEHERYAVVMNRYQGNVRDNKLLSDELLEAVKKSNVTHSAKCNLFTVLGLRAGFQSAENIDKTLFNLSSEDKKRISSYAQIRDELTDVFDTIIKYC